MRGSVNDRSTSAVFEVVISIALCTAAIAAILLRSRLLGAIGDNRPGPHGMGYGELFLIFFAICFFASATITRLVYRSSPARWLKLVSVAHLLLLGVWIAVAFVDLGALLFIGLQVIVGLAFSLIAGITTLARGLSA